jgi:hypothetical protein
VCPRVVAHNTRRPWARGRADRARFGSSAGWCTSNKRIIREWVKAVPSSPCTTVQGEVVMAQHLVFSHLLWIALGWLCLLLPAWWPATPRATLQRPLQPEQPRRTRSQEPPPWLGFASNRSGTLVHALGRHGPRRLHHRPLGVPAPEDAHGRVVLHR